MTICKTPRAIVAQWLLVFSLNTLKIMQPHWETCAAIYFPLELKTATMDMLGRACQVKVTKETLPSWMEPVTPRPSRTESVREPRTGIQHQRLRQDDAGALGQAGQRRGRYQGRQRYRGKGEETLHLGRPERHPRAVEESDAGGGSTLSL